MQESTIIGLLALASALLLPLGGPVLAVVLGEAVGPGPQDRGAIQALGRAIMMGAVALNYGVIGAAAITTYDCDHTGTTYEVLDLHEPRSCPDPERDFEEPETRNLHVLQTDSEVLVHGFQCQVTVTKEVTRCGFDSITYGHSWPVWEQNLELTPQECRNAVAASEITIEGRRYAVEKGVKKTESFFSRGHVDGEGNCKTADFVSGGLQFYDSYERTSLTILVRVIRGNYDMYSESVTFANGVRARYQDEILRDAFEGTIVWSARQPNCTETVSQVYLGVGEVHFRTGAKGPLKPQGAIVMIGAERQQQYAGLALQGPTLLCGRHCFKTHIKGIAACLLRHGEEAIPSTSFKSTFQQKAAALQAQVGHLHIGTNLRAYARFEMVQTDLCETERKVLHGRLQALAGGHNKYSLVDLYGPGHEVIVMGAAVYVARCVPVEATKADFPNCTKEVPVKVGGVHRFADPITWVLQEFPTVTPCSDITPMRWRIGGNWYCATPHPHQCDSPGQLNLSVHTYIPLGDFTEGMGKNLYSPQQQAKHREFLRSFNSREPVLAKVANAASRSPVTTHGISYLGPPLTAVDLDKVRLSVLDYLFPIIPALGEAWNVVAGVLMFLYLGRLIIGCAIRIWVLYAERGCGCWLLGALWGTLFTILRAPVVVLKGAAKQLADIEHGEDMELMPRAPPRGPHGGDGSGVYHRVASPVDKVNLYTEEVERHTARSSIGPEETRRPDLGEVARTTGDQPATAQQVADYLNRS